MGLRPPRPAPAPGSTAPPVVPRVARRVAAAGVVLGLLGVVGGAVPAAPAAGTAAPAWETSCGGYPDQAFAQRIHDLDPVGLAVLDADGDGTACEELPLSLGDPVTDVTDAVLGGVTCATFPSREVAQSTSDDHRARGDDALARALDEDGDGVVCGDHPDDEGAAA